MATYVPTPLAWSNAAVKIVAARPSTSPWKRFSIVATPVGRPVSTARGAGESSAGENDTTSKLPVARMGASLRHGDPAEIPAGPGSDRGQILQSRTTDSRCAGLQDLTPVLEARPRHTGGSREATSGPGLRFASVHRADGPDARQPAETLSGRATSSLSWSMSHWTDSSTARSGSYRGA